MVGGAAVSPVGAQGLPVNIESLSDEQLIQLATKYNLMGLSEAELEAKAKEAGAAVITYGNLVQATINFVIIALFIFIILRAAERMKKKEEAAPAAPAGPTQEELLTQIRDLLKK